ncbi:SRPBCC family protein [candidate division TA06 bacterium]|nr:SRPBCC family protein [candidate division TA06 bacterium]
MKIPKTETLNNKEVIMSVLSKQIRIDAPVESVWKVLADYGGVAKWAPSVNHAVLTTESKGGIDCERQCDVAGFGKVKERIVEWEEGSHYTFTVEGIGPMKFVRSNWSVRPDGNMTIAIVTIDFKVKFGPLGALMDRLVVRLNIRKQMVLSLAGLKHYVETGEEVTLTTEIPLAQAA